MRRPLTTIVALCLVAGASIASARADVAAGKEAYARGDDAAAVAQFEQAISGGLQGAALAEAHRERARSYIRMGNAVKAVEDLDRAIELSPEDGEAYGLRCLAHVRLNDPRRAGADAEAAFSRTQSSVPANICRAEILYAGRRFQQSLASYDEAMRLGANDYEFRTNRALAMVWAGKPDQARQELDLLIDAARGVDASTRAKLFEVRARARMLTDDLDGALADATDAIDISDSRGVLEAERHAFRARIHVLRASFDAAIADLNEALGLLSDARDERLAPLYAMRAGAYASQGELDRAVADFGEAIRRGQALGGPQLAEWHLGRARAKVALGQRGEAAQDFDAAARLAPNNSAILVERGDNRLSQGDPAGAEQDYRAALQLAPGQVAAHNRLGWAHLEQGRYDEAIAAASKVVEAMPESAAGYWQRGIFRFLTGRFSEAAADFGRVVAIRPENMHAMMWGHFARARSGQSDRDTLARQAQGLDLAEWPGPLVGALVGTATPEAALTAAAVDDAEQRRRRETEAHFYLGQQALTRNDAAAAEDHFRRAVAADVRGFVEYTGARIELQRMGR